MYPTGPNEAERLRALEELDITSHPRDPELDSICAGASAFFAVPMAVVTLLDRERQIFGGCAGMEGEGTDRDAAFCNYTILDDAVFVVPDALADERFSNNPFVAGPPGIRFYAGAPLIYGRNIRLGALCLIDTKPRSFSRGDKAELRMFADRVTTFLMRRLPDHTGAVPSQPAAGS